MTLLDISEMLKSHGSVFCVVSGLKKTEEDLREPRGRPPLTWWNFSWNMSYFIRKPTVTNVNLLNVRDYHNYLVNWHENVIQPTTQPKVYYFIQVSMDVMILNVIQIIY